MYTESARKVAYFVENAERRRTPLLYIQDVSGFMVGVEAEAEGIIRAGAEMVETMACATVPKIVLTINHASGAGYYAMAGQGFDPHFTFALADRADRRDGGRLGRQSDPRSRIGQAATEGKAGSRGSAGTHREDARRLRALAGCEVCGCSRSRWMP